MNAESNSVEIILRDGTTIEQVEGPKKVVADAILKQIQAHLIEKYS
jgi:hypothetical protein